MLPTNFTVHKSISNEAFLVVYFFLYPMCKLSFKFEIICMQYRQVMEDFIKLRNSITIYC